MKKITSSILAVALMGIFAIQNTFAQYDLDPEKEVKDMTEIQEHEPQFGAKNITEGTNDLNKEQVIVKIVKKSEPSKENKSEQIFTAVEQKPQFPGGEAALMKWLKANIQYPVEAQEEGAQGRVVVQFVIEKDGSIGQAKIARGRHPALDAEAVRLVKSLPKFTPGKTNGQAVRCWFTFPINFKLTDEEGDSTKISAPVDKILTHVDNEFLSFSLGTSMGGNIAKQIHMIPDEKHKSSFSKNEIIEGVEYVFSISANNGKSIGVSLGMALRENIMAFENRGAIINRELLLKELENATIAGTVSPEKINECNNYTKNIYQKLQEGTIDKSLINNDSLSIASGISLGGFIAKQLESIPDEEYKAKTSKDEIIKGIKYVFSIDSSNIGRFTGTSIGFNLIELINKFNNLGAEIDINLLLNEFKNNLMTESVPVKDLEEANSYIQAAEKKLQEDAQRRYIEERANSPEAALNKLEEEKFMANLKKNDKKVKFTESGVGYKVIKKGKGSAIADKTTIEVAYKGTLADGTKFDDSEGQFVEFNLEKVVPGFADGLRALKEGDKAILYIPSALAYGVMGIPEAGIEPNEMLIFEVKIKNPKK